MRAHPCFIRRVTVPALPLPSTSPTGSQSEREGNSRVMDDAPAISLHMDRLGMRSDDLIEKENKLYKNERMYMMSIPLKKTTETGQIDHLLR